MDSELREITFEFLEESSELLDSVAEDVMNLEKNPNIEDINKIFRAFHSMKGNAGMLGFERLGRLAHTAENMLSLIRKGTLDVNKVTVDSLLGSMDVMHLVLEDIRRGAGDDRDITAVMASLEAASSSSSKKSPDLRPAEYKTINSAMATPGRAAMVQSDPVLLNTPIDEDTREDGVILDLGQKTVETGPSTIDLPSTLPEPVDNIHTQAKRRQGKSLKILIVEDDFTARTILMRFLSEYGDCDIAKDGLEAIQAFTHAYEIDPPQPYDLICMDIIMPRIDGTVAAKTLREIERSKGVEGTEYESVIVFTSATNDPATIVRACYECGANHYFVKPLAFDQMERQMRKINLIR